MKFRVFSERNDEEVLTLRLREVGDTVRLEVVNESGDCINAILSISHKGVTRYILTRPFQFATDGNRIKDNAE